MARELKTTNDFITIPVQNSSAIDLSADHKLSNGKKSYYRGLLEAFLFLSDGPANLGVLAKQCQLDRVNTRQILDEIIDDYEEREGGFVLRELAGGYQFITSENYSVTLKEHFKDQKRERLSRATMETLAIISYQQPITLPEIDEIRGTSNRTMLSNLLQYKLIKPQGNKPVPGRPVLYVTTSTFLAEFSLSSLNDLPSMKEVKELEFDSLDSLGKIDSLN